MEEIKRRTPKTPKPTEADAAKVASLVKKAAAAQSVAPPKAASPAPAPAPGRSADPAAASVAAATAARAASVSPVDLQLAKLSSSVPMYSSVGAHSQQGPSQITSQNVRMNPSLALKSTAGTDSIAAPISAPFASPYAWPRTEHKASKRLSSGSVSSTASSTSTAVEAASEVDQLKSEMTMLQSQLGTLKRHMEEMGQVQARAMAHVMQVLSSTHDSPWGAVMELEDCVETWRCMSEKAAALFPSFDDDDETETVSLSPLSSADEWESSTLSAEPGVEPTMLLLNGASLLDSPALTSVDDGYESLDDAATLEPDELEKEKPAFDPRPSKRRRRTK